jgi:hypothetical protein
MNRDSINAFLLTDEKEKLLWEKSIIVFDSSALLDIYFLPKVARAKIYSEIFKKLTGRLWIPSQVQFEYLKNRESVIVKPIAEKYTPLKHKIKIFDSIAKLELLKKIEEISRESQKDDKHPYIEQSAINKFKQNIENFILQIKSFEDDTLKQIEAAETEVLAVKNTDDVLDALEKSFKVGREFSFEEIIEITKEGKHRYEYKIPPGYGDFYSKDKKGTQIFGDLIIWKQILEFSKEEKQPIIFITNDIKKDEDWCYLDKKATEDRIFSPREELIKEIKDFSGVDFWMYNLPQFLYNANKYLKSSIKEEVIQNISQFLNTKDKKGKYLKFKCDACGRIHKYHELDLDFDCIGGSERNMGAENQYVAEEKFECDCGNDITIKFEVWEYPVGVHNYDSIEIDGAELIESFHFTVNFFDDSDDGFYQCHICDGNNDNVGNYVDFYTKLPLDNEYDSSSPNHKYQFVYAGNCQWCNTLHIKCPRCKSITVISEDNEDNEDIECEGGCGLTFMKKTSSSPDDYDDFTLKLIDHRKIKCSSCGNLFVDNNKIGVCKECDLKLNFT